MGQLGVDSHKAFDAGELEEPPQQHQQSQEDITHQRQHEGDDDDTQGHPADDPVAGLQLGDDPQADDKLPDNENQQHRREGDVHHRVGHEDQTESEYQQCHHDHRQIAPQAATELHGLQPEQQRQEDCNYQPGIGQHQRGGRHGHIAAAAGIDHQEGERQESEEQGQGEAPLEVSGLAQFLEKLREQIDHERRKGQADQQHAHENDDEPREHLTAPLALLHVVGVLGVDVAGDNIAIVHPGDGLLPIALEISQNGRIIRLSLHEDTILKDLIALLRIIIGLLET